MFKISNFMNKSVEKAEKENPQKKLKELWRKIEKLIIRYPSEFKEAIDCRFRHLIYSDGRRTITNGLIISRYKNKTILRIEHQADLSNHSVSITVYHNDPSYIEINDVILDEKSSPSLLPKLIKVFENIERSIITYEKEKEAEIKRKIAIVSQLIDEVL